MNSFSVELRDLADRWRESGETIESLISDIKAEIESLADLGELGELGA